MKSILFVCTGNIFRSMCAEFFLKKYILEENKKIKVSSAGIQANPEGIHPIVKEELNKRNIDYSKHIQRKVTKEILNSSDLVVSMTFFHQDFLKEKFHKDSILFNELCFGKKEDFLDYPDILLETNSKEKAEEYIRTAVKEIEKGCKSLAKQLQ
jgi:protein-tyrosine phosphatase